MLLQLTPETPHGEIVRGLIEHHYEDVAYNRLPIIQRRTGLDLTIIKEAIEVLKHLNPKPGAQFSAEVFLMSFPTLSWNAPRKANIRSGWWTIGCRSIHIPRNVIEMARNKDSEPDAEGIHQTQNSGGPVADGVNRAAARHAGKVTRAIIKHQRAFLDKGPEYIEPLKMQQIADQVGVHVTTVSRAVDDKWVQTPRGIFPLKRFFGGGTHTSSGEEVAWETIKQSCWNSSTRKTNPIRFRTKIWSRSSRSPATRWPGGP